MNKITKIIGMLAVVWFIAIVPDTKTFAATDFEINYNDEDWDGKDVLVKYTGNAKKVVVPDGIEIIGEGAFEKNKQITEVVLPDSVTEIAHSGFLQCTNLKKITLSKNLTRIWSCGFNGCKKLETLKLNKKLRKIDEYVFSGCTGLKKVTIAKGNKYFKIYKGALCSKNMKWIYMYPSKNKARKRFIIPKSVKYIESGAFSNNKYLEEIVVQGTPVALNDGFEGCKSLKKIVFKKSCNGVSLKNCKKLEEVVLAEGTEIIWNSQFEGCKKLKKINFPSSLKQIHENAFHGCLSLGQPVLSSDVVVHEKAFD